MSVWLLDLGNTRLKYAPLHGDGIGPVSGTAHATGGLDPDWIEALPPRIDTAVVASVASPALHAVLTYRAALPGAQSDIFIRAGRGTD